MTSAPRLTAGQAGFTLLEMIVALAALSLLMVMLAGSVQFGARAWEGQSRRVAAYSETDAVHSVLRIMLQGARPALADSSQAPPQGAPPRDPRAAQDTADTMPPASQQQTTAPFVGRPNALEFIGDLPEAAGPGGLYDLRLWLHADGRLLLSSRLHGVEPAPPYRDTELLRDVSALEVAYFAAPNGRQPGGWATSWTRPGALPALISVRVRFKAGDPRVWRELKVAPVIGSPLG